MKRWGSRTRSSRRGTWKMLAAAVASLVGLAASVAIPAGVAGATGGTVTYTAAVNIVAPPSSSFAGSAGGDGWALAMSSTQVFNVFHHQTTLQVACHNQSDASACWSSPQTITDGGHNFYTSGQPGLYFDQSNGNLYVYVTRDDDTAGVECIAPSTTGASSCGFTPLTPVGEAPVNTAGWGATSDPVQVGTNWYAFNFVGGMPTGVEDQLMCFNLTTLSACASQPYAVDFGALTATALSTPSPSIAAFGNEIEIPRTDATTGYTTLGCYNPTVAGGSCGGSWPVSTGIQYASNYGAAFSMLDSYGNTIGFCLPTGTDPCYNLDGTTVTTPANLPSAEPADSPWNGPSVTVGPRVFVANQDLTTVQCFDWSTDASCTNFPKSFGGTITNGPYTVNKDPQRPFCIWVNSDSGTGQIQDFDAYSASTCTQYPLRIAASGFVAPGSECTPTQWTDLTVASPSPASAYGGGSVEFDNADNAVLNTSPDANPATLDSTGSVNLSTYNFSASQNLPDFVITLNTPPAGLNSVTVDVSWQATDNQACAQPGTTVSGGVSLNGPATSSPIGTNQTLTALVTSNGAPLQGATVTFTCVSGPCTTSSGSATSDGSGAATLTYSSPTAGADVWQASYTPPGQQTEASGYAPVSWSFIASASPSSTSYGHAVILSENGLAPTATGTVTFTSGGSTLCTLTLTGLSGEATSCATSSALAPGSYPVTAAYSGDSNDGTASATTDFTVSQATTTTSVAVNDNATLSAWSGTEGPGAQAYATAAVSSGASGLLTYDLYAGDACAGTALQSSTASVTNGAVSPSAPTAPLGGGTYSYQASYGGNANFAPSTSSCVLFNVGKAAPTFQDGVVDAGTTTPWSGSEATGAAAQATSAISGVNGFTPTGTVTYNLYAGGSCSVPLLQTGTTTIAAGAVPNSAVTAALGGGLYSYQAVYSGDPDYGAAAAACQPFTVSTATPTVGTAVVDAGTTTPWSGSEVTGAEAQATSTVNGVNGFTPTGTVTYDLYGGGTCTGTLQSSTETLAGGVVPASATSIVLPAGTYSYRTSYSGDANYGSNASGCVSFVVNRGVPSMVNPVNDSALGVPWLGTETTGAHAQDTATVTGASGVTPTGTVTYGLYSGGTCTGTPQSSTESLTGGAVPASTPSSALAAGTYSYLATYNADGNYEGQSSCTSFTVHPAALSALGQGVDDVATNSPWNGTEATGASAFDTATLTGVNGFTPSGTVTFDLYSGSSCQGTALATSTETVNPDGSVPDSADSAALSAGAYSYQASYSSDSNYLPDTSGCQAFGVLQDGRLVGGVVYDAASQQPWNGAELTGASAYETSTVTPGNQGIAPTGTVTYALYADGTCTGTPLSQHTVTLTNTGAVPNSANTAALGAGDYGFEASYSGDSNYRAATGSCDPFEVDRAPSATTEVVSDAASHQPWSGTEDQGASAYDASSVSGVSGFVPSGTVTYSFYANGSCSGTATSTQAVDLSGGTVPSSADTTPLAPGTYSYVAAYGGDTNFRPSASPCQSFGARTVGYRLVGGDGGVFSFGAPFRGSTVGLDVKANDFVGMAATSNGYWLVEANGGVFSFGGAQYFGSVPGMGLRIDNAVGIAATADGGGYWIVTSGGNVFPFGDAVSHGTLPGLGLHVNDIVGIASHDSGGYWLVGADGGVFAFGDAHFYGSMMGKALNGPAVGMTPSPDGAGYWLAGRDGGVFAFGDAQFHGSCLGTGSGCQGVGDVVGIAEADGGGYWLTGSDGGVFAFGDAQFQGNELGAPLMGPIMGITRAPNPGS